MVRRVVLLAVSVAALAGGLAGCDIWAPLVVDSTADGVDASIGDGQCATSTGTCTLRAATQEANALGGPITIVLADDATYVLSIAGAGEDASATGDLDVTTTVAIAGNGSTIDAAGIDRVLDVVAPGSLTLRDTTITGGRALIGGGIQIDAGATALVTGSTIEANRSFGTRYCVADQLDVRCSGEATPWTVWVPVMPVLYYDGGGAGIASSGNLSIASSTIADNVVEDIQGTACYTLPGGLGTTVCTYHDGGGLLNRGQANLVNVTISGNHVASGEGSAIATDVIATDDDGSTTLVYVTIADNTGTPKNPFHTYPVRPSSIHGRVTLGRTAVTGDIKGCSDAAQYLLTSLGDNVFDPDPDLDLSCDGSTLPTDQQGVDALLGPLADNGGATRTHLPLAGSPLIDAIDPSGCGLIGIDQRGEPRAAGSPCSVGSVEP